MIYDNKLLLIILIGIIGILVVYYSFGEYENFDTVPSELLNNDNNTSYYDVSNNNGVPITDVDESRQKLYNNGLPANNAQQLFDAPPNLPKTDVIKEGNEISKPIDGQPMFTENNLKYQDKFYKDINNSFMLIQPNSIPDKKFEKVLPKETRKTLTTLDLLPIEDNKDWFQNPSKDFNLMQAVDLELPEIKIGVDTVGQSKKNANYDIRGSVTQAKFVVSPWNNSTIEPDYNTKSFC